MTENKVAAEIFSAVLNPPDPVPFSKSLSLEFFRKYCSDFEEAKDSRLKFLRKPAN